MERRFTLRLGEQEILMLEKLKEIVGENTDTGVIRFIINHYSELNSRYLSLRKKYSLLENQYDSKVRSIGNFLTALKDWKVKKYKMFQKGNKIVLTDGDSLYRNKYRGKKAKIEAINRYAGISIPVDWTSKQVNDFIEKRYFGKKEWAAYLKVFESVASEKEEIKSEYSVVWASDNTSVEDVLDLIKNGNYVKNESGEIII